MIIRKIVLVIVAFVLCVPVITYAGGKPFEELEQQIDDLQNQINNKVEAGQMCPEGTAVIGFNEQGIVICSAQYNPGTCPCWSVDTFDEDRFLDEPNCIREEDPDGPKFIELTSQTNNIRNFLANAGRDLLQGIHRCHYIDEPRNTNIQILGISADEVSNCYEILRNSLTWDLNCPD